jgi:CRP-like cAMP-binding protein
MQSPIQNLPPVELAIRALEALAPLNDADRELAVEALRGEIRTHRGGADLGDSGDKHCWILIQGWACRARVLPDGRRQIFNFLMPGDVIGLTRLDRPSGMYRVIALNGGATLDASGVKAHVRWSTQPSTLTRACVRSEHGQTSSLFDHITRLGARTAYEAVADLFLDLYCRSDALGRCEKGRFALPLSQAVLSDALGVSPVQINRVLARMRKEGLVAFGLGWVEVPDPAALAAAARTALAVQPTAGVAAPA